MRYIGDKKKAQSSVSDRISGARALDELRDVHGTSKRATGAAKKRKTKNYRISK